MPGVWRTARTEPASPYPPELRERAVRMVAEMTPNYDSPVGSHRRGRAEASVSGPRETVRKWVRQAEIDAGQRRRGRRAAGWLPRSNAHRLARRSPLTARASP